ncbi:hypothetical protein RO3G_14068 [Rhizopus delemar RA 99-880]|uniref:Uncharacterized protein n=1 Tax=Rhizopus delemar (strain RA 99-880 / ATCC MYA-4621 / FGSC 9543 / NRRL 43880) TaxID=246409 RepID=I1CLM7_RHIO9|nr:hypothetical protein RO3G_14068 [Rhizopus delemar RA 99-880]|eukprot:EIE89357.1 hypothetical protein RO3G_14068 [Rhizopus delemar RA 99-880]
MPSLHWKIDQRKPKNNTTNNNTLNIENNELAVIGSVYYDTVPGSSSIIPLKRALFEEHSLADWSWKNPDKSKKAK